MWVIFRKELSDFFSSLTGYVAGLSFLVLTGLFLWVFPGEVNVLDTGRADLGGLFRLGPWLFLFLIPSITMRMLAEERREGTLEWLLSKPVGVSTVVCGKFLAALVLVVIMLLPTLVYAWFVYILGEPVGSLDVGATVGSYFGLVLLSSSYVAVGIFASSLTRNAVVSFVLGGLLSLALYQGFSQLSMLEVFRGMEYMISSLGVEEHYLSIRRGVVDSRDVIYFLVVMVLGLSGATLVLRHKRG